MVDNFDIYDLDSDYNKETFKNILLKGPKALNNYIFNLLTSCFHLSYQFNGDRLYEPTYGCMLEHKLFEPVDDKTANEIVDLIHDALNEWIPELGVSRSSIAVTPTEDEQGYKVIIIYQYNDFYEKLKFDISRGSATLNQ